MNPTFFVSGLVVVLLIDYLLEVRVEKNKRN